MNRKFATVRPARDRVTLGVTLVLVIGLGLASRRYGEMLPRMAALYAGDALWALAAFLVIALLYPAAHLRWLVAGSACVALSIEMSQLAHPAWLEGVRRWPGARLLLGYGFLASDLACYAVGIAVGALGDQVVLTRKSP